jgi:hypothetical protein
LALMHPVFPNRWGAGTIRNSLGEATKRYLTLDDSQREAALVVCSTMLTAQEVKRGTRAPRYAPAGTDQLSELVAAYRERMERDGSFAKAATVVGADGQGRVRVQMPRYHDLDQAAGLLARVYPDGLPRRSGLRSAHEGLIFATKSRMWPAVPGVTPGDWTDRVEVWRQELLRLRVFPSPK